MKQAIGAYRHVTATSEFRERERLRSKARHDEAQALRKARIEGAESEREKWQGVVADKDTVIANKEAENEKLRKLLAEFQINLED